MIINIQTTNIKYDTDELKIKLPTELRVEIDADCIADVEELIADAISDKTGWLVENYDYEIISIECTDGIERTEEEYDEWLTNLQELAETEPDDLTDDELEALQNEGLYY